MSFYKEVPGRQTTLESTLKFDTTPTAGSTNPVTSEGVANAINESAGSITALIPEGTTAENPLVNASGIANKADANKVIAIADAKVSRSGQSGAGWYKIAECSLNKGTRNISASWDVLAVNQAYINSGNISLNYRYENSTGIFSRTNVRLDADSWDTTRNSIKVAHQITTDKIIVEIWVNSADTYSGFAISERNSDNYSVDNVKAIWTYTSYIGNGGSSAPVTDASVTVTDVNLVIRQHAIASPTNNNLVAMDENGIAKDSGIGPSFFTDDSGDQMTETPPKHVYDTGKFYFISGQICRCTAYSADSATFDVYGVVEALNYVLSHT